MMRFFADVIDALKDLFANKSARMTMVVSILIYACMYPQPYVGEIVRDVPMAIIDQDGSTASRELTRRLDATDGIKLTAVTSTLPEAERLFYERKVHGIVLIPTNFERDLLRGRFSPIAAYGDGSYFVLYNSFATAVSTVARNVGSEVRFARLTALGLDEGTANTLIAPVTSVTVPLFNPTGGYASYIVPAAFVLIIQQTLLMGISIIHAGQRSLGARKIFAAAVAYIGLYTVWVGVTQLLLPKVYGLPQLGDPLVLLALTLPFLIAVTAFGFALSQVVPTREAAIFFLVVQGIPLFFMTGIAWPIESILEPIRTIALAIPSTSAIPAFVRVDQMGASLSQVLPSVALQMALAVGYSLLAYLLLQQRRVQA